MELIMPPCPAVATSHQGVLTALLRTFKKMSLASIKEWE